MSTTYVQYPQVVASSVGPGAFPLRGPDGTAAAPTYSFTNDTTTGAFLVGTSILGFSTNGVQRLQISSSAITSTLPISANSVVLGSAANTISALSTIINTGTLTLPTSTDTLVGKATTDILTNKSISGSTNTLSSIADGSLSTSYLKADGTRALTASWAAGKRISISSGSAAGSTSFVSGTLIRSGTSVANSGTAETDLHTMTLLANTLGATGDTIVISGHGFLENNADQKTFKVYHGATAYTLLSAVTTANKRFSYEVTITRTGSATQRVSWWIAVDGAVMVVSGTNGAVADSSDQTVKSTGQSNTASNDIFEFQFGVNYQPNS